MMDQSSVLDVLCVLKATQALASGRAGILTKECLRRTAAAALQGCLDSIMRVSSGSIVDSLCTRWDDEAALRQRDDGPGLR